MFVNTQCYTYGLFVYRVCGKGMRFVCCGIGFAFVWRFLFIIWERAFESKRMQDLSGKQLLKCGKVFLLLLCEIKTISV